MSKKSDLKHKIADSEREIQELEKKIWRSLCELMESILNNEKPSDADAEYFKTYKELIKVERENLRKLNSELEELNKK